MDWWMFRLMDEWMDGEMSVCWGVGLGIINRRKEENKKKKP